MSEDLELKKIVGQVAAAYFGNSHVTPAEIPGIIIQVANSLAAVGAPAAETPAAPEPLPKLTSVQVRKSITRDALISFEDNKPYKTLRRHLSVKGLTPDDYRSKWGLPKDYPMVAPAYSEARSNMAKAIGLGARVTARGRTAEAPPAAAEANAEPAATTERPKKAPRAAPARTPKAKATRAKAEPAV